MPLFFLYPLLKVFQWPEHNKDSGTESRRAQNASVEMGTAQGLFKSSSGLISGKQVQKIEGG